MPSFQPSMFAVAAALVASPTPSRAAFVISAAPTLNVTCTASGCAPTATDAVLNLSYLIAALESGDFALATAGSGVDAEDIAFLAPMGWHGPHTLSLTASNSVIVNKKISVDGYGGLTIVTHTNGAAGRLMFGRRGRVRFAHRASALRIDGNSYELVRNLAELNKSYTIKKRYYTALMDNYDASGDGTYASYAAYAVGQFDGLGNSILNVTIADANNTPLPHIGLIYYAAIGISNVRLLNVAVTSQTKDVDVGGLMGYGAATFSGDEVTGTVRADYGTAGGLIGVGLTGNPGIIASSAHVQVTGQQAGGLIGYAHGVFVSQSSASGDVVALKFEGGGLIGFADTFSTIGETVVSQSFATGNVTGQGTKPGEKRSLGGLIGKMFEASVNDCYAFGSVSGTQGDMGGLIGSATGVYTSTSYSTGSANTSLHAGGFVGYVSEISQYPHNDTNDYWDKATSGNNRGGGNGPLSNQGITGLNTRQLKAALPPGFSPAVWAENRMINNGYPYLIANPPH